MYLKGIYGSIRHSIIVGTFSRFLKLKTYIPMENPFQGHIAQSCFCLLSQAYRGSAEGPQRLLPKLPQGNQGFAYTIWLSEQFKNGLDIMHPDQWSHMDIHFPSFPFPFPERAQRSRALTRRVYGLRDCCVVYQRKPLVWSLPIHTAFFHQLCPAYSGVKHIFYCAWVTLKLRFNQSVHIHILVKTELQSLTRTGSTTKAISSMPNR